MSDTTKRPFFDVGGKNRTKRTTGTIQTLSACQKSFCENAQNITLNLAKMESAGVITPGASLVITTSGVYITWADETKLIEFASGQEMPIDIPGGDRRNTKYNIDTTQ